MEYRKKIGLVLLISLLQYSVVFSQFAIAPYILAQEAANTPILNSILGVKFISKKVEALNNKKEFINFLATLKVLQETMANAKSTTQTMGSLYKKGEQIYKGVNKVLGVDGFAERDALLLTQALTGIDLDPTNYLPNVGPSGELKKTLRDSQKSASSYYDLQGGLRNIQRGVSGGIDKGGTLYNGWKDLKVNKQINYDLEEAENKLKLEKVEVINRKIIANFEKVVELRELAVDTTNHISTYDRLEMNEFVNEYIVENYQLRKEIVVLLKEVASNQRNATHQLYDERRVKEQGISAMQQIMFKK